MAIDQAPRLYLLTPDLGDLVYPMGSSRSSCTSHVLAGWFNGLWSDYWATLVASLDYDWRRRDAHPKTGVRVPARTIRRGRDDLLKGAGVADASCSHICRQGLACLLVIPTCVVVTLPKSRCRPEHRTPSWLTRNTTSVRPQRRRASQRLTLCSRTPPRIRTFELSRQTMQSGTRLSRRSSCARWTCV